MAWVSVHDTVDGPKLRDLHKKLRCSKFEALGILNFLWFWGLNNADKEGHIRNADEEDIARYLYGAGAGCRLTAQDIVKALLETGWLDQKDGVLYIHDWEIWQEQWYLLVNSKPLSVCMHSILNGNFSIKCLRNIVELCVECS